MSYDIHITRAAHWAENDERRIALDDWISAAHVDSRLEHRGGGTFVATGLRSDGQDAAFHWFEGDVYTADPDEPTLAVMRDLARALGGQLQGDDGEEY